MPKKDKGDEQSANATASEEQENTFEGLPKAPPANEEGGTSSERNNESPEAIDASGFVMEVKMYDAKSYAGRLLTGVKAVPKRVRLSTIGSDHSPCFVPVGWNGSQARWGSVGWIRSGSIGVGNHSCRRRPERR